MKFQVKLSEERMRYQERRVKEEERNGQLSQRKEKKAQRKLKKERKRLLDMEREEDKEDAAMAIINYAEVEGAAAEEKRIMSRYHRDGSGSRRKHSETDSRGRARNLLPPKAHRRTRR